MSYDEEGKATVQQAVRYSLFFSLLVLLPTIEQALFGWACFFIPVTVLIYLYRWRHGFYFVLAGAASASLIGAVIGSFAITVFAIAFIPVGYVLAHAAFQGNSPSLSGGKGVLACCLCWLLLLAAQTLISGSNPMSDFSGALTQNSDLILHYYQDNNKIPPDRLALLKQSLDLIKTVVLPAIFPALLLSLAMLIVWGSMLAGNHLVSLFTTYRPWPDQRTWRLPDQLIWLFLVVIGISLLPLGIIRLASINGLICLALLYFFQGFSNLIFFLNKWKVPLFLRFIICAMMLLQYYGTILLMFVGISDVWLDLRRLRRNDDSLEQ